MILAAVLMPPKFDDLALELLENCSFIMVSSSSMADGCTVSNRATRWITSGRISGGRAFSTSAATSYSRTDRIMAITCGCSCAIISLMDRESIQRKISMPRLDAPGKMRPSTVAALSGPSARLNTFST